jgi:transcriptional regulator with XRE-family HTH domain
MPKRLGVPKNQPLRPTQFRAWRKFRDLTQQQVADRIGTTKTRVSRKEAGKEPYDQYYLEALAAALNADVTSLLARDPSIEDSLYKLFDSLSEATRAKALEVVRALKIADEYGVPDNTAMEEHTKKFRITKQNG